MKYSLIDKLVCPDDRHFPFELQVLKTGAGRGAALPCVEYCAKHDRAFGPETELDSDACRECAATEIETGRLRCPACGDIFEVEEGIPRLLHAFQGTQGADDKQNEMRARDEQAVKYDSLAFLRVLSRLEIPITLDLLDSDRTDLVIELGSGTGRLTEKVAGQARNVIAVDFSFESLARAKSKCAAGNVDWVQADINLLPFRDEIADHLLSSQVFEHLPGASVRNMAVDEAARILKPRGTFVISVYRDSWFWRLWGPKEGYHAGGIYYCRLSGAEFASLLGRQFSIRRRIPNVGMYLQIAKCVKNS